MALACCVNVYMVSVHTGARMENANPNPNPNSHDHWCTGCDGHDGHGASRASGAELHLINVKKPSVL